MDSFYWIVLAIAVVFLIIGLTASGMMLRHDDTEAIFPKSHGNCPDGWKHVDGKCYFVDNRTEGSIGNFDSQNYGKTSTGGTYEYLGSSMPKVDGANMTAMQIFATKTEENGVDMVDLSKTKLNEELYGHVTFHPDATICQKKAWADHHKIKWDGVTNYNNC